MRKSMPFSMVLVLVLISGGSLHACTGVRTESVDGDYFRGRTMEFAAALPSDVIVIPAGWSYTGTTPDGTPGMQWESRYSVVGVNAVGLPHILDGVNEEGLSAALFYFSHFVGYQTPESYDDAVAPWEFGTWILGSFATVEEVRNGLDQVEVCAVLLKEFGEVVGQPEGIVPPGHFLLMDPTGDCITIEHIDGEVIVTDNPLGILTNCPSFDWHMSNLSNYVNLSPVNAGPVQLMGMTVSPVSMGSGLLGLPGDFTSPSRFVRSAIFSSSSPEAETPRDGVLQTFRLLNQFDIPEGASQVIGTGPDGEDVYDITLWSSVTDLSRSRYYFRTRRDSRIRMVDLLEMDLQGDSIHTYPMMDSEEEMLDITGSF